MIYNTGKYHVSRKAILIGAPSKGGRHLPGVSQDLAGFRRYLKSDKAGRWFDNEIITLPHPDLQTAINQIHSTVVDYLIVYFSGHGATIEGNKRVLEFRDGFITDTDFLNACPRQVVICDACSNYIQPGISGIPEYGEEYFHFDGIYKARELFDQYILNSPCGKIIVHSTQLGQPSYDSIDGGYFTQGLLNVATKLKTFQNYYPLSIADVLRYVPGYLQKRGNNQIPTIYAEGNLNIPFAFGFQKSKHPGRKLPPQGQIAKANDDSSNNGLVLLSLGLLALAVVAANK
ncbi:MAG: caspase family protein [Bacteroidetes bacterium]|nr:caspase family protein [Bacteroidota bacterium]